MKEQVDPVRKYCSLMEERERLRSMRKAGRGVPENLGDDTSCDPPGEDMEQPRVEAPYGQCAAAERPTLRR